MFLCNQRITILMQKVKGFKEFMYFNQVLESDVKVAADYIKLRRCEEGEILFLQFDKADKFYGVLVGEISIKLSHVEKSAKNLKEFKSLSTIKDTNVLLESNVNFQLGKEILTFKSGQCFGQWGVLENKERTASAVAKCETILFEIDRKGFEKSFKTAITKAESNKKLFFTKTLSPLEKLPQYKIEQIYKSCIPKVFF